ARVHARGHQVDWSVLGRANDLARELPTYAFQHQRYWLDAPAPGVVEHAPEQAVLLNAVAQQDADGLAHTLGLAPDAPLTAVLPALHTWSREQARLAAADALRYRVSWTALPSPTAAVPLDGTWLVAVPGEPVEPDLVVAVERALVDAGARVERCETADLCARLAAVAPQGVLCLPGVGAQRDHDRERGIATGALAVLDLLHTVQDAGADTRVWALTRDAVRAQDGDAAPDPWQAQVWGLGRVAALEHPTLWGGLIDVSGTDPAAQLTGLAAVLADTTGEDQIALRGELLLGRRLIRGTVPTSVPEPETGSAAPWADGSVLITGGTGALGAQTARWLARNGARTLVLTSRQGPAAPAVAALRTELEELGADVVIEACDVTDAVALATLRDTLADAGTPVRTVVHTAGVASELPIAELDEDAYAAVVRAKVVGAQVLDEILGDELAAFVVYSSIAGVWGSARAGAYAAGNAHLDALIERRRAHGRPGTALAWGPWGGGGMADERLTREMQRRGISALDPEEAVAAFGRVVRADDATVTLADIDWARLAGIFTANRPSPLFDPLVTVETERGGVDPDGTATAVGTAGTAGSGAGTAGATPLVARWTALSGGERRRMLVETVCTQAAAELGHASGGAIEPERPFRDLGFDSLAAVGLRQRLEELTGLKLPATLVFDHPTPMALAQFVASVLVERVYGASGASAVFGELDRLETALAALDAGSDPAARGRITLRLSNLLTRFQNADDEPAAASGAAETAAEQLGSATDDQLFDLIEKEFGIS
ncbi:SDR family NAD(P)-dependent oxidoreductase, partial [Streptomyces shenzhenensis]|uniref:type I polyketide synthase n=1 Tax=Streptomyces shenzhenensis TaxID=943815 RepID=UPI0037F836AD